MHERAAIAGVVVIPWRRCYTRSDISDVLSTAKQNAVGLAILNIENEFETVLPPDEVMREIRASGFEGEVAISTVSWLYNATDFRPLGHLSFLLQIFPEDNRWDPATLPQKQADCVFHARDMGVTYVGVTLQTYRADPAWFVYQRGTRSLYTGDDVGAEWDAWRVLA